MLKFVYSFFLGLLIAVFVGMGVATFYPSPEPPVYPKALESRIDYNKDFTEDEKMAQTVYNAKYEVYDQEIKDYHRNVAMIVLGAAVVLMVVGLLLESRINVIADGLLLGGTFTLIYSIGRSFSAADPKYSFMVVSAGLLVTMAVGYVKFIRPGAVAAPATKKRK